MEHPVTQPDPVVERPERSHLPQMLAVAGSTAPAAPSGVGHTGVSREILLELALKAAYTVPQFNTGWLTQRLHLPQTVVEDLLEQLRSEHLVEVLGAAGPFGYRFAISGRGRERASRLMEISGYIGPAPVSLESYTAFLKWQMDQAPRVTAEQVTRALASLVLTEEALLLAGLAASSGRSLFVFGPPGNGKTTLGRLLHNALEGGIWVPHCLVVHNSIIRVYDPQLHKERSLATEKPWLIDPRWVYIDRPLIVGGGEMTLGSFDLAYSSSLRYHEAPLPLKANGGTFLIDDFGRQRVDPHELLNRWIIPLEHQIDYLTLHTGQKIQVPFRQLLIVATNLDPNTVTDPAFLRRMGYRLHLNKPSAERYREIFQRYASGLGLHVSAGLLSCVLDRYQTENRELRCCEPRDLIERVADICRFRAQPLRIDEHLLSRAWGGYFGCLPSP
jgi:hypothetical protein